MTTRRLVAWIIVIPFGPIAVAWTFFETLFRECVRACWYAWNDAMIEVSAIRRSLAGTDTEGTSE